MTDSQTQNPRKTRCKRTMKLLLQFASGPFTLLVLYLLPYDAPSSDGRIALAIFGWMVMWWMTQPVPWAITAVLPLLLFPGFQLMTIGNTVSLYGQNIFFWVMGTILMGYAMQRHGLAKRFALWFLSRRAVGGNTYRLVFGFMLVTALGLDLYFQRRHGSHDDARGDISGLFCPDDLGDRPLEKEQFGSLDGARRPLRCGSRRHSQHHGNSLQCLER